MNFYELLYITDPSNDEGIEDVKKRIEGIITGREGSVISYDKLGKKRLAYPIQKRQYGVYFLVNFNGDGRIIQALEYFLRLNTVVLRHLILTLSEKQLRLKELTEKIQREEAERMRLGGRPLGLTDDEEITDIIEDVSESDIEDEISDARDIGTVEPVVEKEETEEPDVEISGEINEPKDDEVKEPESTSENVEESKEKTVE